MDAPASMLNSILGKEITLAAAGLWFCPVLRDQGRWNSHDPRQRFNCWREASPNLLLCHNTSQEHVDVLRSIFFCPPTWATFLMRGDRCYLASLKVCCWARKVTSTAGSFLAGKSAHCKTYQKHDSKRKCTQKSLRVFSLFHNQGLSTDFFLVLKNDHKINQRECLTYCKM